MPKVTRRSLLAALPAVALLAAPKAFAQARPQALALQAAGEPRRLPERIVGASLEALIEHLIDDPAKVAAVARMNLAYCRFPGGSQSNFYDWRSGHLDFRAKPSSSAYVKFWAGIAPRINAAFPDGVHYEDYVRFARAVGADPILLPNLETSTLEDQTAWLRQLASEGIAPHHVEMGNEFYLAMLNDPDSMARWPNLAAQQRTIRRYADAFRPYLPKDVKIATQAADEGYFAPASRGAPFVQRLLTWNNGLKAEDWFDAVTIHTYCAPENLTDETASDTVAGARSILDALMAHADDGLAAALAALARRVPGKEIWITEWSRRGGGYGGAPEPLTDAVLMHAVARTHFTVLRGPAVAMTLYFTVSFAQATPWAAFLPDGKGGYMPRPQTLALGWLGQAANGGRTYQRFADPGATRVPGGGKLNESYSPVEAGLFRGGKTTLLVQNAAASPRSLQLPPDLASRPVEIAETLSPALTQQGRLPAAPMPVATHAGVDLPAYSLTRLVWAE